MPWNLEKRMDSLIRLGRQLREWLPEDPRELEPDSFGLSKELTEVIDRSSAHNPWFTTEAIRFALWNWGQTLTEEGLMDWITAYELTEVGDRNVAVITAGNIPMVGWHDIISVYLGGQRALCKLSSQDPYLIPFLWELLNPDGEPDFPICIPHWPCREFEAVIATGSDNTNRYFEYYFGAHPHIFRKNRTSVARLSGEESEDELRALIGDMFLYFGLGCRNVSKLFIPDGYDLSPLASMIAEREELALHHKFTNNYHYQKAVCTMNSRDFLDCGNALLLESSSYHAPVSTIHYEYYNSAGAISDALKRDAELLQCKVRSGGGNDWVRPGMTQRPSLKDYADGKDTLSFVLSLNEDQ